MTRSVGGYGSHHFVRDLRPRWLGQVIEVLYPPMPTLNIVPNDVLHEIQTTIFKPSAVVLNIGSGGQTGCGRRLWDNVDLDSCHIICVDLGLEQTVDLCADAHRLPIADASVDAVVMQAVLEHLVNPRTAIEETLRVLRPGAYLYIEVPFLQGFHADPHDYQRYTLEGLRERLRDFDELQGGVSVGPFCSLVWLLRDGLSSCFRNRWLYFGSRFLVGWALSPLRYLDYLARGNPVAVRLANEYYYLGRKPPQ